MAQMILGRPRVVVVDGVNKGEVFRRSGRWFWRRGPVAVEPFAHGSTLADVAEWARKCCNGKTAIVKIAKGRAS